MHIYSEERGKRMDFIMELLVEIILDGTIEVCNTKTKSVPVFLRVLAGLIVGAFYGGLFMVFLYLGIANRSLVVIGISILFLVTSVAFLIKSYRAVRKKKREREV